MILDFNERASIPSHNHREVPAGQRLTVFAAPQFRPLLIGHDNQDIGHGLLLRCTVYRNAQPLS